MKLIYPKKKPYSVANYWLPRSRWNFIFVKIKGAALRLGRRLAKLIEPRVSTQSATTSHKSFAVFRAVAKERLVAYFKRLHPSHKFLLVFYAICMVVAIISSTRNANHQLQVERQAKQAIIIQLREANEALLKLQALKAESDSQLAQNQAHQAEQKAKIDDLNTRLLQSRAPIVPSGFGGATQTINPNIRFGNSYAWGNCTWAVASWIRVPDDLGNANTWDDRASGHGYLVTTVPKIGSVAQTDAGGFGHVALVIAISGGQVEVREMNVAGLGIIDVAWYSVNNFRYIYF